MLYRIRIEVPAESDKAIVQKLRDAVASLGDAEIVSSAPPDSYSLTVHVLPDEEK
jgi:hypothetical protein